MKASALNLLALRACNWPVTRLPGFTVEAALDAIGGKPVTRRSFLALGGAALGASAATLAVPGAGLGSFEMDGNEKRIAFLLGGRERWVIDPSLFAGAPQLRVSRGKQRIRLALRNARFPGTKLPADFVSELQPTLLGWQMKIRMKAGEFQSEVPFERWLMGELPAVSRVSLNGTMWDLAEGRRLLFSSPAMAEFHPNWVLRLEGDGVAEVLGVGAGRLRSDSAAVSLLTSSDPSMLSEGEAGRSLVALDRGRHFWEIESATRSTPGGRMTAEDSLFDRISIEAGETRRGFVAESLNDASRILFEPARQLLGHNGESFWMPLHKPRYAVTWDENGEESALVAEFPKEPVWLHANGCTMQVGSGPGSEPFELVHRNGEITRFQCAPNLLRTALPLPGAISEPTPAAPGAKLSLISSAVSGEDGVATSFVSLDPEQQFGKPGGGPLGLQNPSFQILRPQDLLSLGFQCTNLMYIAGPNPTLNLMDPSKPAYITVYFQPQHIAEEAFYETATEFPEKAPAGIVDHDPPANAELLTVPVRARLSGASQLVFELPGGVNQIPYSLDSLLGWSKWSPLVAGNALPEPIRILIPGAPSAASPATIGQVRQIAPSRAIVAQPANAKTVPAPPTSVDFLVQHPAFLGQLLKQHPEILANTPGLQQGLGQFTKPSGALTPQALQTLTQLAQAVTQANPGLGNIIQKSLAITVPDNLTTAIEAPYRLFISPSHLETWLHSTQPVAANNGATELWNTRLAATDSLGQPTEQPFYDYQRIVRAIWSPDYTNLTDPNQWPPPYDPRNQQKNMPPFRTSLDSRDRYEIVRLTSDFLTPNCSPAPVQVKRLMLTTLGASMDMRGEWGPVLCDSNLTVLEWKQLSTMGRDHYVKVVYRGFLLPFGIAASLIKVTERKFQRVQTGSQTGSMGAFLRQRMYVVVRQPEKTFPAFNQANGGRAFPFRTIELKTLSTPALDSPSVFPQGSSFPANYQFFPQVGGQYFQFAAVGTDADGMQSEFSMPMLFVSSDFAFTSPNLRQPPQPGSPVAELLQVLGAYNTLAANSDPRTTINFFGQKVAYADSTPQPNPKKGNTTLETQQITFGIEPGGSLADPRVLNNNDQPNIYPTMMQANVRVPALAQLLNAPGGVPVKFYAPYVAGGPQGGFDPATNNGEVYLQFLQPQKMNFSSGGNGDKSGGMVTPNMALVGLSRKLGTVGGKPNPNPNDPSPNASLGNISGGKFDPSDVFGGLTDQAKILGGISLSQVIGLLTNHDFASDDKALKISTRTVYPIMPNSQPPVEDPSQPPQAVETSIHWAPQLQNDPTNTFIAMGQDGVTPAQMNLDGRLRMDLASGASSTKIDGNLANFQMNLFGFIVIAFDAFNFHSETGKKLQCTPKLNQNNGVQFAGPLSFVNQFKDLLNSNNNNLDDQSDPNDPSSSGGGGAGIQISPTGVKIGYTLAIPSISVGVMSIDNLSLSASLNLPFTGDPASVRFAFCEKHRPFIMSYCIFAGGGFFGITLSLKDVEVLEAALEFGGNLSINLGVASGGVHIMAGIYFRWEKHSTMLSAYLRMGGALMILGLVNISLEFVLSLNYEDPGRLWGQATLTVCVEVAMFSKSVELTAEKEFTSQQGLQQGARRVGAIPAFGHGGPNGCAQPPGPVNPPQLKDVMTGPNPQSPGSSDWEIYLSAFAAA